MRAIGKEFGIPQEQAAQHTPGPESGRLRGPRRGGSCTLPHQSLCLTLSASGRGLWTASGGDERTSRRGGESAEIRAIPTGYISRLSRSGPWYTGGVPVAQHPVDSHEVDREIEAPNESPGPSDLEDPEDRLLWYDSLLESPSEGLSRFDTRGLQQSSLEF
ncbi:hypothetical protein KUCAC02_025097 [Chaenocephalus aceratus]|nr:hypothetical protein KUCAC02_025097 [Chaenocephalus aceratus]